MRWKLALARACGVSERTVHRWASGRGCPRPVHCQQLAELAVARHSRQAWVVELNYRTMIANITSTTLLQGLLSILFWIDGDGDCLEDVMALLGRVLWC
jgi:hypothetical protein